MTSVLCPVPKNVNGDWKVEFHSGTVREALSIPGTEQNPLMVVDFPDGTNGTFWAKQLIEQE